MLWILPLFPAQPKLGPVYQHITHMDPLYFPVLLIAPAFVLDVMAPLFRRPQEWSKLSRAVLGTLAVALTFPFLAMDVALDLLFKQQRDAWNKWLQAAFAGIMFLAILIAVEWPFATFLMSPAARHWFLAPNDFPYFAPPTSPTVRHVFVTWEATPAEFWRNIGLAFMFSVVSMRIGITFGNWLSRVKR